MQMVTRYEIGNFNKDLTDGYFKGSSHTKSKTGYHNWK